MVDNDWLKLNDDLENKIKYNNSGTRSIEFESMLKYYESPGSGIKLRFSFDKKIPGLRNILVSPIYCGDEIIPINKNEALLIYYYETQTSASSTTVYSSKMAFYKINIPDSDTSNISLTSIATSCEFYKYQSSTYSYYIGSYAKWITPPIINTKDYYVYIMPMVTPSSNEFANKYGIYRKNKTSGSTTLVTTITNTGTSTVRIYTLSCFNMIGDDDTNYVYYTGLFDLDYASYYSFSGDITFNPSPNALRRLDIETGAMTILKTGIQNNNYNTFVTPIRKIIDDVEGVEKKMIYISRIKTSGTDFHSGEKIALPSLNKNYGDGYKRYMDSYDINTNTYKSNIVKYTFDKDLLTYADYYTGAPSNYFQYKDYPNVFNKNIASYKNTLLSICNEPFFGLLKFNNGSENTFLKRLFFEDYGLDLLFTEIDPETGGYYNTDLINKNNNNNNNIYRIIKKYDFCIKNFVIYNDFISCYPDVFDLCYNRHSNGGSYAQQLYKNPRFILTQTYTGSNTNLLASGGYIPRISPFDWTWFKIYIDNDLKKLYIIPDPYTACITSSGAYGSSSSAHSLRYANLDPFDCVYVYDIIEESNESEEISSSATLMKVTK